MSGVLSWARRSPSNPSPATNTSCPSSASDVCAISTTDGSSSTSRTVLTVSYSRGGQTSRSEIHAVSLDSWVFRLVPTPTDRTLSRLARSVQQSQMILVKYTQDVAKLLKNSHSRRPTNLSYSVVGRQGFEPWTPGLKVRCSDQAELTALDTGMLLYGTPRRLFNDTAPLRCYQRPSVVSC